jgi:predicted XRE-type DNA-binding protein
MANTENKTSHVSTLTSLWEDLGFSPEEAAVLRLKTALHIELMKVIEKRKLSPKDVGKILDMQQPNVSNLLNGKLERTTADRLTRYLHILGREVRVTTSAVKMHGTEVA